VFGALTPTNAGRATASDATVALGAACTCRVRGVSGNKRSTFSNTVVEMPIAMAMLVGLVLLVGFPQIALFLPGRM
jgi:hypothetical protein